MLMDDANSPEINKRLMGVVSSDFVKVSEPLREASYQIRKRGFSDNPIFVASQREIELGITLIGSGEFDNQWNYRASYLDEFVQRQLVSEEAVADFQENYKNPDEYCCLFVVEADFAGFIFVPFPED